MTINKTSIEYSSYCDCEECEQESRNSFLCHQCDYDTLENNEYYMLHDSVWLTANKGNQEGMLCIGCVEVNLNRQLTRKDFTDAPINNYNIFGRKSLRLIDRLNKN